MSKIKNKKSTLAGLIDSDDEDQLLALGMPTPDSSIIENMAPVKKGRGRPKAAPATATATSGPAPSKVTKVKPASRRLSGRASGKAKAPVVEKKGKRTALTDKTNLQSGSDTEEVEEFGQDEVMEDAELEEPIEITKKPKTKAAPKKPVAVKAKPTKPVAAKKDRKVDAPILPPQPVPKTAKRGRTAKKDAPVEPEAEVVIPETQIEEEDEMEIDADVDKEVEETNIQPTRNAILPPPKPRRQHSIQRRHAGSGSDTERNDPTLRRKLGELTKKFEALNAKHQDLREIGLKEGERNFEKMRKQNEENVKKSNEVISSLKADLAYQTSLAKDSKALKKKIESQKAEITAFQTQVAQLKASLAESQAENKTVMAESNPLVLRNQSLAAEIESVTLENKKLTMENKTLTSKLAANRTAAASVESLHSKVPGSAAKPNGGIRMVGTAEAAQLAQAAQLKEDIYSDLTGLVIQGVKRDTDDDIFNCLQTSRNGTLHFKLATANEKSAESYDERQCTYVPQLDPSRDQELIELLPDYLVDEITFPRHQAAKFYARVVKALTEKPA